MQIPVLQQLQIIYPGLAPAERKVADCIRRRLADIPYMSVSQIAQCSSVSVPTVTRLTQKLGFPRFKDFKVAAAVSATANRGLPGMSALVSESDTDQMMVEKTFNSSMKTLQDTLDRLEVSRLAELAEQLARTDRILFVGQGSSGLIAAEAALRLTHLDLQAESYADTTQSLLQTQRLRQGQVLIGITHSGRTSLVLRCLDLARSNQATTALITNYPNPNLHKSCDFLITTAFVEQSVRAAALSSRIAQLAILDAIYLLTAKKKQTLWDFSRIDAELEQHFRIQQPGKLQKKPVKD